MDAAVGASTSPVAAGEEPRDAGVVRRMLHSLGTVRPAGGGQIRGARPPLRGRRAQPGHGARRPRRQGVARGRRRAPRDPDQVRVLPRAAASRGTVVLTNLLLVA